MGNRHDILTIFHKEVLEHLRRGHLLVGLLSMVVLWAVNIGVVGKTIASSMGKSGISLLIDNLVTHQSISFFFIATFMLMTALFKKEKTSGSIECLMTTPLDLVSIWLGKTLTMWLTALVLSYTTTLIVYLELHFLFIPSSDFIVPELPAIIFLLVVYPVFTLALCALFGLLQFAFPRAWAGGALYLFMGMGYLMLTSSRMKAMVMTWNAIMAYIVLLVIIIGIISVMRSRLSRENILLSEVR